jgi:hypothetical protein
LYIDAGELGHRIEVHTGDVPETLASPFDEMLANLGAWMAQP